MKTMLIAAAACLLGGCAMMPPSPQEAALEAQAKATVPHCTSARQCEGEWAAAREWVTSNCPMKIQTMTDSYISTYNGVGDDDADISCSVSKDPMPAGGYQIAFSAGCGNMFGCVPSPWQAAVDFNKAVNAAGVAFASAPPAVPAPVAQR